MGWSGTRWTTVLTTVIQIRISKIPRKNAIAPRPCTVTMVRTVPSDTSQMRAKKIRMPVVRVPSSNMRVGLRVGGRVQRAVAAAQVAVELGRTPQQRAVLLAEGTLHDRGETGGQTIRPDLHALAHDRG